MTDPLDLLQINLNTDQLFWINICLAFLMFGVALDIRVSDFKAILQSPRSVITGLIAQWVILPLLTWLLIIVMQPHPGLALGMILVAACPGGNISNFLVHLSNGNRALSVSMTSITTLSAFVVTPFSVWFWSQLYAPTAQLLKTFTLSPIDLLWVLVQLIVIPLFIGMWLAHFHSKISDRIRKPVRLLSIVIFMGIIIGALFSNTDNLFNYLKFVFVLVLLHNLLAFFGGWASSKIAQLGEREKRTIMIETAIQNSGLGLIIIFNFYEGMSAMALVAAWWAIWHLVAGFSVAIWWRLKPIQ
jgi:BASS family bile acid:Na+ symporter